jgi:hypothetical protein
MLSGNQCKQRRFEAITQHDTAMGVAAMSDLAVTDQMDELVLG